MYTASYYVPSWMNRGKVGELDVKTTSHWGRIDREYWTSCGITPSYPSYFVNEGMVRIQHRLFNASTCNEDKVALVGDLYSWLTPKDCYRCPYHEDLLPNWGEYISIFIHH